MENGVDIHINCKDLASIYNQGKVFTDKILVVEFV